ncbi:MAG TPA: cytochrome c biogenesis protein/redoxin [Terriglobales bacterium]|nr:cytochrome c biogenesis protein/redoxin [Terriglobales bacterium]
MPYTAVFFEGLLSFFSPCVLPLLPLYLGYLATPRRGRTLLHTVCFVAGISAALFALGAGASALGGLFSKYAAGLAVGGGLLIILMGLFQLGVLNIPLLQRERRAGSVDIARMNPVTAFFMGFFFSFGWTPCIGPVLASVVVMTAATGRMALIAIYTAGFCIPFLAVGFFSDKLLGWLKENPKISLWAPRVAGAVLIAMGVLLIYNGLTTNRQGAGQPIGQQAAQAAPDFTLTDQYGVSHTLSDYQGKVVFLNFWATWCKFCVAEMPDIEALYGEYHGEVIFLSVAENSGDPQTVAARNGATYPVLVDESGELFRTYGVSSLPTTYMIKPDGSILGYARGQLTPEEMRNIIAQAGYPA